jgi:hypothetical protein
MDLVTRTCTRDVRDNCPESREIVMRAKIPKRLEVARSRTATSADGQQVDFRSEYPLLSAQNPPPDHAAYLVCLGFVDGKQADGNSERVPPLAGRQSCKPALSTA